MVNASEKFMMEPAEKGKELLKTYAFENPEIIRSKHSYEKDYYLPLNLGNRKIIIHYTHRRNLYIDNCLDRFALLENHEIRVTEKKNLYRLKGVENITRLNRYPVSSLGIESFSYLIQNSKHLADGYCLFRLDSSEVFYKYLYKLYLNNKDLFISR
ncbi:hypothetical protein PB01_08175 [Psychrobacillus glaciei]|uniref:Uncharacterized protein n=1 Tax=Psychrobacillus glaciei TaxID=2283160 RepID=A0A5J6SLL8_9BACI|nr:hypothetical protein [Psychrobacillus glaciei]QFF98811.1 hypothetical protein PB01_08175 [Psychrobacillus glaciei]